MFQQYFYNLGLFISVFFNFSYNILDKRIGGNLCTITEVTKVMVVVVINLMVTGMDMAMVMDTEVAMVQQLS